MLVDLRVAQLLCSRMCHDLVGPAGAINAGLELMEEDAGIAKNALELVGESAQQVTRRLSFYRMAFGTGGGAGGSAPLADARKLCEDLLAEGGVRLDWSEDAEIDPNRAIPAASAKLVLNLVLLGAESLPRGGSLSLRFAPLADGVGVALTAAGQNAAIKDEVWTAMDSNMAAEDLSVRTVHGYFTARLAEHLSASLEISESAEGEIRLAAALPI